MFHPTTRIGATGKLCLVMETHVTAHDLIDKALEEISLSFRVDEVARAKLRRILDTYPDTTPAETWIALPLLFWQGTLDTQVLRKMPYDEFLKTPYWAAVSEHVKSLRPWCVLCTEPLAGPLRVHHRTYVHRGDEWRHLEDLSVICDPCHSWHHQRRPQ